MHAWEQIQITVDYIEDHIGEEISIQTLANQAALSPFYYQRLFKRLVKKSVVEYIKLRRMAKAADMLLHTNRRILDIAVDLGFATHEHFTRTFKNTFGMPPEEYRKNPQMLNFMTKPELLLNYVLIDEGVPLITNGIILEMNRYELKEPKLYAGYEDEQPVTLLEDLGTESGVDPLEVLWNNVHEVKERDPIFIGKSEEIGVALGSEKPGYFKYYAGALIDNHIKKESEKYQYFCLEKGEYVICTFEAEDFNSLILDALYKASDYLFRIWLPKHNLETEPFSAEVYESHTPETNKMELWVKLLNREEEKK